MLAFEPDALKYALSEAAFAHARLKTIWGKQEGEHGTNRSDPPVLFPVDKTGLNNSKGVVGLKTNLLS